MLRWARREGEGPLAGTPAEFWVKANPQGYQSSPSATWRASPRFRDDAAAVRAAGVPRLTFLDLIGVYDALRRVTPMGIAPDVSVTIIGTEPEIVDDAVRRPRPGVYEDLTGYDVLFLPAGSAHARSCTTRNS